MALPWRRYKSSQGQALRTPSSTTWCTLQRTRYGAPPAQLYKSPHLQSCWALGDFLEDETMCRLVLPESWASSWGRRCGTTPVGLPALPDSLFPYRWACRCCLSMATPTSPQPSFATRMVPLTSPSPMMGVTSLQPGGRSALLWNGRSTYSELWQERERNLVPAFHSCLVDPLGPKQLCGVAAETGETYFRGSCSPLCNVGGIKPANLTGAAIVLEQYSSLGNSAQMVRSWAEDFVILVRAWPLWCQG